MAKKWHSLDNVDQEKFRELAAADKLKYTRELQEFKANLSDEHKFVIAQKKAEKTTDHRKVCICIFIVMHWSFSF